MKPLLRIQSVPIAIEYKVTRAALRHQSSTPEVDVTRKRGNSEIYTQPARVYIDSTETRASAGNMTHGQLIRKFAEDGKQSALDATTKNAESGNKMLEAAQGGSPIRDMANAERLQMAQVGIKFIPSQAPSISVDPAAIQFNYSMDKLTFDWNINLRPQLEYLPGEIEFSVTQQAKVEIEYLGEPIYCPPSADPNYEPAPQLLNSGA